ncbi:probable cinnamyl alcohol dehydrogenase 1 [Arachis hypogaea]|uniref:probable cinnamyl alcohol dehydrogenase 1 n=1 Tax=Arachis hypogaea TaxID=3818 RepID=UPI000DED2B5E|nr:probable cinnamyl alcohol dehydrogenase 1 [Arachis hypogaea]
MFLLKTCAVLALVGAPSEIKLSPGSLIGGMRSISESAAGGIKDTQEMIDLCAEKEIYPNIEVIPIEYANEAFERIINKDVKYSKSGCHHYYVGILRSWKDVVSLKETRVITECTS